MNYEEFHRGLSDTDKAKVDAAIELLVAGRDDWFRATCGSMMKEQWPHIFERVMNIVSRKPIA